MAVSTYKERVEGYVGTVTDTTLLNAWLNEAAQWVVSILPQSVLANYATEATISAGSYSVGQKRVVEATHNGYPARRVNPWEFQRASVSTSLYKADATDPMYYIRGGRFLILPSDGTNKIYFLEPPALTYNDSSVSTLPHQADNLIVLWTAIQIVMKNLQARIGVLGNISVEISMVLPSPPSAPSFTTSDALASTISVTSIGAFPTVPTFVSPSISLTAVPAALDLSSITAPTPPTVPTIAYSDAVAGNISQTTIGALPSAPVYVPPTAVDFSSLPLPSAVTISANVPIPPSPPTFTYTDATAAAIVATTIGAFPSAPTYAKPTFSYTSQPTAPDFSSITTAVSEPGAPSFSYDPAAVPIIGDIGLSALPSAPVFVPPTALNFTGMTFPADLDTSSVVMPTPPVMPTFTYTDGTSSAATAATATEPSSPPTFTWTPPTAPTFSLSIVAPSPPGTPSLTWVPAEVLPIIANVDLDLTSAYDKLTNVTTGYIDGIEDIEVAMAKIQEIQSRIQEFNIEADTVIKRAIADAQARGDINKFNALNAFQAELQEHQLLLQDYSTKMEAFKTDVQAQAARISAEVQIYAQASKNGLDNALGEFNELNTAYQMKIQKMVADLQAASQKALQDAQLSTNVSLQNAAQQLNRQVQQYSQAIAIYQADVQAYGVKINALVSEHRQNVEAVVAERNAEIARYQGEMQGAVSKLDGEVRTYQAQSQVVIAEAQTELQRVQVAAQTTTQTELQNALQSVQTQIAEYQAKVSRYSAALQQYQLDISKEAQEYNFSLERVRNANAAEGDQYQKDLYNELNEFNAQLQTYQIDVQKILQQAQIAVQEKLQQAQLDTQVDLENRIRQFNAQVQEYAQSIATFGAQVQAYQADVASQVQIGAQNLARIIDGRKSELERYGGLLQNSFNEFQEELARYQAEVNKVIQQAQLDQQRLIEEAQLSTNVSVANEAKTLEALIQDYALELQLYQAELTGYQYKIQAKVSEYGSNLQRVQTANGSELQKYQLDITSAQAALTAQMEEYRMLIEKEMKQAELTQQRLIEQARLDVQAGLDSRARQLNAAIAEYNAQLERYRSEIQGYASDVQRKASEVQSTLARESMITQTLLQQLKELRTELQTNLQLVAPGIAQEAV